MSMPEMQLQMTREQAEKHLLPLTPGRFVVRNSSKEGCVVFVGDMQLNCACAWAGFADGADWSRHSAMRLLAYVAMRSLICAFS